MKRWTLTEATQALPAILAELRRAREILQEGREDLDAAKRLVYLKILEPMTTQGVIVRSLRPILLDFPTTYLDKDAYLCYKEGEAEIAHWHPFDTGFDARKPIPKFEHMLG